MASIIFTNGTQPGRKSPPVSIRRNPQDDDIYIHPYLVESYEEGKGRQLQLSAPVPAGTILMKDAPYAMVPTAEKQTSDPLVCSSLLCRQRVPQTLGARCPNNCAPEVIWCSENCRAADQMRHAFECRWLKQTARTIREVEGENDFAMLWLIVRLLAERHIEACSDPFDQNRQYPWEGMFKRGWASVDALRGKQEMWPKEKLQQFTRLVETHLCNQTLFNIPKAQDIVALICQEEMNSFWLCPVDMTMYPPPNPLPDPGLAFGMAIYPRAAMVNHSCFPNITHSPDSQGRMVYTAYRDIEAGEECLISYINLTSHVQLWERQRVLQDLFQFECLCERCACEQASLIS